MQCSAVHDSQDGAPNMHPGAHLLANTTRHPCCLPCSRGEAILVQRYISTRPLFTNLRELQFAAAHQQQHQAVAGAGGGAGAAYLAQAAAEAEAAAADLAALRGLSSLYKSILSTMRDEAVVIEQVRGRGRWAGRAGQKRAEG
jgi:hypothetical protein